MTLKALGLAASFLFALVAARATTVADFGVYQTFVTFVGALTALGSWGAPAATFRAIVEEDDEVQIWRYIRLGAVFALLGAIIAWFSVGVLQEVLESLHLEDVPIAWLGAVPALALLRVGRETHRGLGSGIFGMAIEDVLAPGMRLAALVGATWLGSIAASTLVGIFVVTTLVAVLVIFLPLTRFLYRAAGRGGPRINVKGFVITATALALNGVLWNAISWSDTLMLAGMQGPYTTAQYAVAFRVAAVAGLPIVVAGAVLPARLLKAQHQAKRALDSYRTGVFTYGAWSLVLALGMVVVGPTVLHQFGGEYGSGSASTALGILLVAQVAHTVAGPIGILLNGLGFLRSLMVGNGIAAAANIGANLYFIPKWGAEGAAMSSLISLGTMNVLLLYILYRRKGWKGWPKIPG